MPVVAIIGAQWGDEGKGKVVDLYTEFAQVVVRFGGGSNAGHTLVVDGEKLTLRVIPSGILRRGTLCVLGQGMVIDPEVLLGEMDTLAGKGHLEGRSLAVSRHAHVVLPYHQLVDELRESGPGAIGTTKKGIGPAYEDKAARRGIRFVDLADRPLLRAKLERATAAWKPTIESLGGEPPEPAAIFETLAAQAEKIVPLLADTAALLHDELARGRSLLLEGAQGTLLDLDHGTYPFVTSSSCTVGGAITGSGLSPRRIDRVIGITKAYATRVGAGPFPTELGDEAGNHLRRVGGEYGSVTGRPRRCGWLDLPALRRAVLLNGFDGLALTKLDVLTGMPEVKACVAYEIDGRRHELCPTDAIDRAVPIYETFPGWTEPTDGARTLADLPAPARRYVESVESLAGCPVVLVGVGPAREQTIVLSNPFRRQ
ncbi:MAG: adenylosuccinate synthase [Deltaproteobacteria bacterium]|nr:adenylosuccinate synthase [Deltaproteobacteria bacterium]